VRYMIIYQKNNGDMLYRYNKNKPIYKKGDTTSMGWKVIDIRRMDNGNILSLSDYRIKNELRLKLSRFNYLINNLDFFKLIHLILIYIIFVKIKLF